MTTLMDEDKGVEAYKAARARGDTQGQYRAHMRAMRDMNRQLIQETAGKNWRRKRDWRNKIRVV